MGCSGRKQLKQSLKIPSKLIQNIWIPFNFTETTEKKLFQIIKIIEVIDNVTIKQYLRIQTFLITFTLCGRHIPFRHIPNRLLLILNLGMRNSRLENALQLHRNLKKEKQFDEKSKKL